MFSLQKNGTKELNPHQHTISIQNIGTTGVNQTHCIVADAEKKKQWKRYIDSQFH